MKTSEFIKDLYTLDLDSLFAKYQERVPSDFSLDRAIEEIKDLGLLERSVKHDDPTLYRGPTGMAYLIKEQNGGSAVYQLYHATDKGFMPSFTYIDLKSGVRALILWIVEYDLLWKVRDEFDAGRVDSE